MTSQQQQQQRFPITYRQPFKGLYVTARVLAVPVLLFSWLLSYTLGNRPRSSWTLKQCVMIRTIRWLMPLNASCGLSPESMDKTREVQDAELKETSFLWLPPADDSLVHGIAKDDLTKPVRIPGYVWPKGGSLKEGGGLVGLWLHGGGYMMGHGGESFGESAIPRAIHQNSKINRILSVDYRLSGEACHPGQLLDALAAYAYLVQNLGISPSRIVLLGASAGGHLTLLLLRYLYEERVLAMPGAAMLFSPWVDMVIDREIEGDASKARPNTDIDYLATSYLANRLFLGHNPESILSTPYMSANLAPPDSYTKYPKMFISVGDAEAYQRECEQLADCLRRDGADITMDVQADAVHDFWGMGSLVPSDPAREKLANHVYEWTEALDKETEAPQQS